MIEKIKALGFDLEKLIVVGSGPMEIRGLRQANDIDLAATADILEQLEVAAAWHKSMHVDGSPIYTKGHFQIGANWFGTGTKSDFVSLLNRPDTFNQDGVNFVGLPTVLEWKKHMNRPKDQADIKLIENYLASQ